jgi:predicted Rossmann fold nucleotide-binding protein DprA/Smf involved in DNA uptake
MKREPSDLERSAPSRRRAPESTTNVAWTITKSDPAFPPQLAAHPQAVDWRTLYGLGHQDLLRRKCLGLICSVQCPGSVVIKTFDAIRELRDAGIVVAGGFHSPMEKECLEFLLRGEQPVIVVLAKSLGRPNLAGDWRAAIDAGRLLILSPFADHIRRTTLANAHTRNEFIADLAVGVLIPHASPGGKAEMLARAILQRGKTLYTFDDEENLGLLRLGGQPFDAEAIRVLTA